MLPARRLALLAGLCIAAAGCSSSTSRPAARFTPPSLPLSTTFATGGDRYAVIPMGELGSTRNTFWQVFVERSGSDRWALATPPGVADNEGLVPAANPSGGSAAAGSVVVGVVASDKLGFSPVASSTTAGLHWAGSTLPTRITPVPAALAGLGGGRLAALVGSGGTAVMESGRSLSAWRTTATLAALRSSAAGRACGLLALTAITAGPTGALLVGGRCSRPGEIGLFQRSGGVWRGVAGHLVGQSATSVSSVAAVVTSPQGAEIVLAVDGPRGEGLVGLEGEPDGTWRQSSGLVALPAGSHVQSLQQSPGRGAAVLLAAGSLAAPRSERLEVATGTAWRAGGGVPAGTQAVSFSGRQLTAFVVERSTLVVEERVGATWRVTQRVDVPIQYGSSG
jgi:hypothetical protein